MAPPLTAQQKSGLYDLYYVKKYTFGRDKLWRIANAHGLEVSQRQVADWLRKQETWQLFQRRKAPRIVRSTTTRAPNRVMGIDLANLQLIAWDGVQYLLTAIDLFSKKAWVRPLTNKRKETVAQAMENILAEAKPRGIRSDQGSEFVNPTFRALLKRHNVKQILSLPGKPQSNGQVERLNGILKGMIKKAIRASDNRDWPSYLHLIVDAYNNSYQTTIKMTPNEAHALSEAEYDVVASRIRKKASALSTPPLFRVGDTVRVAKSEVSNDGEIWSKSLHRIVKVLRPRSTFVAPVYRLDGRPWNGKGKRPDWMGNKYEEDLMLVEAVENKRETVDKWEISKLLRKQTRDGVPGYMVKWKGYKEPTWEPVENLKRDVPKLLKAMEKR